MTAPIDTKALRDTPRPRPCVSRNGNEPLIEDLCDEIDALRAQLDETQRERNEAGCAADQEGDRRRDAERALAASEAARAQMREALEGIKQVFDNSRRAESKGSGPYTELFSWTVIAPIYDAALEADRKLG